MTDKKSIKNGIVIFVIAIAVICCIWEFTASSREGSALINEVCSNNFSAICDEDGEYADYVELYNPSDKEIDYVMYLSDDGEDLKKRKIATTLPPKGFLLVWLSDSTGSYFHPGFKVSKDGEQIFLSDITGNILDTVVVPALPYNVTYSRETDGGKEFVTATATPGESNGSASFVDTEPGQAPVFSLEDGFYDVGTVLTINADNDEKIYYTLDGSVPSEASTLYTGPITLEDASLRDNYYAEQILYPTYSPPAFKVDKANIVRAVSIDPETGKKSQVATHTYFCGFDQKPLYDGVGIVSLVFDPEDLFDYDKGIFALGKRYDEYKEMGGFMDFPEDQVPASFVDSEGNTHFRSDYTNSYYMGRESEREAVMASFDEEKKLSSIQDIGVRVAGESSRYNYQKSLNLYARDIYEGDGTFFKGFFSDREKKVRLRRGDTRMMYQEPMLHSVLSELGLQYLDSQMKAVFINGEYWGIYNLREQYDDYYFLNHLGIEEQDLWLIKNNEPDYGGDKAYDSYDYLLDSIIDKDLSDKKTYDAICSMVDIDNLIDYFCALIYFDDEDIEPRHNQTLWRSKDVSSDEGHDGLWRWAVYDLDVTCVDPASNTFELYRNMGEGMYLPGYLYANPYFKQKFHDRMLELMDTTFSYENLHGHLTKWDEAYRQQNIATVNRFDGITYTEEDYEKELKELDDFFRLRSQYMRQYLEEEMNR